MRTPILSFSIPQVLLLSVVFSSNALAQVLGRVLHPPEHSGAQARFDAEKIGEPSGWKILIDDNGSLDTFLILPDGDLVSGSLATSVTVPRDYCVLPGWSVSAPHVVLLAGVDSLGRGVVEVVQVDPLTMVPVSLGLGIYPGYEFLGVAFDPYQQRIALLDGVSQILIEAPWSPSLLLPMVTSFTAWDMSAMPSDLFLELSKKNLTFVDVGEGFPPSAGQYFIGFERDTYSRGHFLVPGAGATAYEGTWFTSPASYPPFSRSDNEGATVMLVQGRPGSTVEVVRHETDAVIGQVAIPFAGWQFSASYTCPLSQPLEIGETYVVRYTGESTDGMSTRVLCVARYGLPGGASPSGLTFGRVPAPRGAFIGNEEFDVTVPITGGAQLPGGYHTGATAVLAALRGPGGLDPLIPNPWGGNQLIEPVFLGFIPTFILPDGAGEVRFVLPLPNEPSIVGEVVLTQFLVAEPGAGELGMQVAASEVVGVELFCEAP